MSKYLYNDVELPALPSVDKNTFPYAIILPIYTMVGLNYVFSGKYSLRFLASDVLHINSVGNLTVKDRNADLRFIYYETDGTEWTGDGTVKTLSTAFVAEHLTWANYDVLNADGSVYLPASEPTLPLSWNGKTPYRRMNNQWVKQDTYKRVNGEWVKQDEFRRES